MTPLRHDGREPIRPIRHRRDRASGIADSDVAIPVVRRSCSDRNGDYALTAKTTEANVFTVEHVEQREGIG